MKKVILFVSILVFSTNAFACIGPDLTDAELFARKANIVHDLLNFTKVESKFLHSVKFKEITRATGARGDCLGWRLDTTVSVKWRDLPKCESVYEIYKFVSTLSNKPAEIRFVKRRCDADNEDPRF